ncbi:MAG: hypothetical protein K2X90_00985 [Candidatus Babeliaceae bacterium]|nr:hypothetical protein [Candidatus Babeliaceae bacterium]
MDLKGMQFIFLCAVPLYSMQHKVTALHKHYMAESEGDNCVYLYLLVNGEKDKFRSVLISPKEPTVKRTTVLVKSLLWSASGKYLAISLHEETEKRVVFWDIEDNQFVEFPQENL